MGKPLGVLSIAGARNELNWTLVYRQQHLNYWIIGRRPAEIHARCMIRQAKPNEVEIGVVILGIFAVVGLLYVYLGGVLPGG